MTSTETMRDLMTGPEDTQTGLRPYDWTVDMGAVEAVIRDAAGYDRWHVAKTCIFWADDRATLSAVKRIYKSITRKTWTPAEDDGHALED